METVRRRHLVWINSGEGLGLRYRKRVMVLPCLGAAAVAPLVTGAATWGALFTMFLENDPGLDAHARRLLTAAGPCIAWVLQGVADAGAVQGKALRAEAAREFGQRAARPSAYRRARVLTDVSSRISAAVP
ncbi:hypothetical protein [Streptomyces sp. NBC_00063]|uniref:hypothetical protein n=1 Tax=Streptomyces sp. NBC_00063 TaxID=2975638 RepID=UPI003D7235CC